MQVLSRGFLMYTMLTNPRQNKVSIIQVMSELSQSPAQHGRNIVGFCVRFHILLVGLGVVEQSLSQLSQHFFYSVLAEGLRNNVGSVCTALPTFGATNAPEDSYRIQVLWVVSFPRCCRGANIVGICCIRLHTTANKNATTPTIVVPTMLGVVASFCSSVVSRRINC